MGRPSLGGNYLVAPEGGHEHRKPESQEGRRRRPARLAQFDAGRPERFPTSCPRPRYWTEDVHILVREERRDQLLKVTENADAQRETTRP